MMSLVPQCQYCKFWRSFTTTQLNEKTYKVGFCHRYPPSIIQPQALEKVIKYENPRTLEFNWCGEYQTG